MARILLVKASRQGLSISGIVPPLGLLYLAAVLRRAGHQTKVFDAGIERFPLVVLDRILREWKPHIVGFSAVTLEVPCVVEAIRLVRAWDRHVPVIVGGPQATAMPKETLELTKADAVVVGEAEDIIAGLVEALLDRSEPGLPGVWTREVVASGKDPGSAPPPELDSLPLPAWDLVDVNRYFVLHSTAAPSPWRYATMVMSRGCPFRCIFCHSVHGKKLRKRSIENISEELDYHFRRLGPVPIEILDDSPNLDLDWAKSVLETFLRHGRGLTPAYTGGLRVDRIDSEFIRLSSKAKMPFACLAFETGDPEMQRRIKKHLDLEKARQNATAMVQSGIYCNGTFMLGFPGETLEQMWATISYAISLPLPQALFFRVVPLPGSELWNEYAKRFGERLDLLDDYFFSTLNLSLVPDRVFRALHIFAYMAFYGSPRRIARILSLYPNKKMLPIRVAETLAAVGSRLFDGLPSAWAKSAITYVSRKALYLDHHFGQPTWKH